jgi:hypothetical protein
MEQETYSLPVRCGLRVSPLCLGTMTFGSDWGWGATPAVTAPIIGVRPLSRLKGNLGAVGVTFTADRRAALEKASAVDLGFPHDLLNRLRTRRHVFDGSGLLTEVSWRATFLFQARPGQGYHVPGAVTVTASLLVVFTLSEAQSAGWASLRTAGSFAAAAILLAVRVMRCGTPQRTRMPSGPRMPSGIRAGRGETTMDFAPAASWAAPARAPGGTLGARATEGRPPATQRGEGQDVA